MRRARCWTTSWRCAARSPDARRTCWCRVAVRCCSRWSPGSAPPESAGWGCGSLPTRASARAPLDQLRAELGRVAPRTSLEQHKPKTRIDLAVVTDTLAPGRNLELELLGVPALVVRVCDDLGLVGPLVLPGRTACQHCLDLHRIDQDPFFSTLHAQLGQLVGSAGPATLQATAALAVEQALLGLDALVAPAQPPPTLDAVLELDLRRGRLRRRPWSPHPECGCGAADTVPDVAVFEAVTSDAAAPDGPLERRNPTSPCVSSASG